LIFVSFETMRPFVFISVVFISFSCMGQRNSNKLPDEDLSVLRPRFSNVDSTYKNSDNTPKKPGIIPKLTVNAKVDAVLDSIDKLNVLRKFVDGFTIQIYSGQNREEANDTKKKMADEVSDMKADLQYLQPKFRVKTGSYFTRLEAQKDLIRLRRIFPNAILVPERILIK
jgi:SPOR domain